MVVPATPSWLVVTHGSLACQHPLLVGTWWSLLGSIPGGWPGTGLGWLSLRVMIIRDADPQRHAAACAAIYGPYVSGSGSSPLRALPPTAGEMMDRIGAAYAWVVAEQEGATAGYAYGSSHRERAAYRWAADVAVYIDADHHRPGIGRALYTHLFEQLRAIGLWTLCAGITQPNDASNGPHRTMGIRPRRNLPAHRLEGRSLARTSSGCSWTSTPMSQAHQTSLGGINRSWPTAVPIFNMNSVPSTHKIALSDTVFIAPRDKLRRVSGVRSSAPSRAISILLDDARSASDV